MNKPNIETPQIAGMHPALRDWTVVSWGTDRFDSVEYSIHKAESNGTNTIVSLLLSKEGSSTYFNVTQCTYADGEDFFQRTLRDGTTDHEPTTDMVIGLLSAATSQDPEQAHLDVIPVRQPIESGGVAKVASWSLGLPQGMLASDLEDVRQDYIRRYVSNTERPWIVNRPLVEIALARCARIGNSRLSELSENFARQVAYITEERSRAETREIMRANQRRLAMVVPAALLVAGFNGFLSFEAFSSLFSSATNQVVWLLALIFSILLSAASAVSGYLFGLRQETNDDQLRMNFLATPLALACFVLPALGYTRTLTKADAFFSSSPNFGSYSVFVGLNLTGLMIVGILGYLAGSARSIDPRRASTISTLQIRLDQLKSTTLEDAKRVTAEVEHERLELLLQFAFMNGGNIDINPADAAWRSADDLYERIKQVTFEDVKS